MKKGLLVLLILTIFFATNIYGESITFFYSETCPHCHEEGLFLDKIQPNYPELEINRINIADDGSVDILMEMGAQYGFKPTGVPVIFIGEDHYIGYNSDLSTGKEIEESIVNFLAGSQQKESSLVSLPFMGKVDPTSFSLPIFTIILGGLDGFNPCAMWVLTFLLSILIYAKSRKKMLIIGGVFIFTSGLIYFIFMAAWLNFFLFVGYITIMRVLIGIIAITAGLINIKEIFWFKKGPSLTIDEKHKPKLYKRMREIVHEKELPIAIVGTVTLAIFVNFIELLCTAGLPAIYTNILTLNNLSWLSYYSYLALYNLIYILPLLVILVIFVMTMGRHKFTENQGKLLKLISGLLMLTLGLLMLLRPELLSFA